jgi:hypothetical protein
MKARLVLTTEHFDRPIKIDVSLAVLPSIDANDGVATALRTVLALLVDRLRLLSHESSPIHLVR